MNFFYTSRRNEWRDWLKNNFQTEKEIWFMFPMKESKEPSLSYNDAVEEALCFGWIDSTIKHIDPLHRVQRFTPRKPNATYSRANVERLIFLESQKMICPEIRDSVIDLINEPYKFPKDIVEIIKSDELAWKNYKQLPEPYKRIRIAYVDAARKRPLEFERRLKNFISKTRQNKLIAGFGGIDKYYYDKTFK